MAYSVEGEISATDNDMHSYNEQLRHFHKESSGIKNGAFYNTAKILVINTRNGKSNTITVKTESDANVFKELSINLQVCWSQNDSSSLFPESKALLEIYDIKERNIVFSGWIFAANHSIAQPFYKGYLFFLVRCML